MDQGNSIAFQRSRRIGRDVENSDQLTSSAGVFGRLPLCIAKIKSACEINNIHRCRVTCYTDENCLVRSFGEDSRPASLSGTPIARFIVQPPFDTALMNSICYGACGTDYIHGWTPVNLSAAGQKS
jgi:hypothetical protein